MHVESKNCVSEVICEIEGHYLVIVEKGWSLNKAINNKDICISDFNLIMHIERFNIIKNDINLNVWFLRKTECKIIEIYKKDRKKLNFK